MQWTSTPPPVVSSISFSGSHGSHGREPGPEAAAAPHGSGACFLGERTAQRTSLSAASMWTSTTPGSQRGEFLWNTPPPSFSSFGVVLLLYQKKYISFSGLPISIEMLKITDGFRLVDSKNSPRQALGWNEYHPRIYLFVFVNFSSFQNAPRVLCVFRRFAPNPEAELKGSDFHFASLSQRGHKNHKCSLD